MTESARVVVRGEAVAEVLPDAAARARGHAAALGARLTGLVEVRDAGTGGAGGRVAKASLAVAAPALELQPGPSQVHGSVEMTFTMSPPDQEVYAR
ncbi:SIMPL domain-containing protein [Modestobacter excelsi]|uniref:SIMPL domain-containing protein n=1 Tax=Modestobacter excelsi TaxID=2213161 RepID=UPI00110CBB72|nr:SIMPL domain-containing protein [Modestobacter excelsi]